MPSSSKQGHQIHMWYTVIYSGKAFKDINLKKNASGGWLPAGMNQSPKSLAVDIYQVSQDDGGLG